MWNHRNARKKREDVPFYENGFEDEQRRLEKLITQRYLPRPKTTVFTVILWVLLYAFISWLIAAGILYGFQIVKGKWLVYLLSYVFFFLCFLKIFCIKSVECYQHYAKESTRRRCVCMPSCSEYAIAVLKKYNTLKALTKIRKRLFKTCGRFGYIEDKP